MVELICLCIEVMSFREGRVDLEEGAAFSLLNTFFCIAFHLPYHSYHYLTKLSYIFLYIGGLSNSGRKCKASGTQLETGNHFLRVIRVREAAQSCPVPGKVSTSWPLEISAKLAPCRSRALPP